MSYKQLDVEAVLEKLTLQEKISFLSGTDQWHLFGIDHAGIPAIRVSDGPNGIRGTKMFNGTKAACLPCGTALAATWDLDLIRRGGELQAEEAIAKGVSTILGPTTNMQRSPLGGRGFESFSEDPVLAGLMSAATVEGIQSKGVSATIKHFVCNDQEHERMIQDSRVSERALREIYTMPFQLAQLKANPWAMMTSYNRVNGTHASENEHLLKDILRKEWGYEGLLMSDWFGTYSTTEAIKAGLDLEMPGPSYIRGTQINLALNCGKLIEHDLDVCVRRILTYINKLLPLGIPSNAPEETIDTKETSARLREIASSSVVLLKNENNVLPFQKSKSIAVIGPNAKIAAYSGGGSASLLPYYAVTPFDGISSQAEAPVTYSLGCTGYNKPPLISNITSDLKMSIYTKPSSAESRELLQQVDVVNSDIFLFDFYPPLPKFHQGAWYADIVGHLTPDVTGTYDFSLSVAGTAKLYIDNKLVIDNATEQKAGGTFFGLGTVDVYGSLVLTKGVTYTILVEFGSLATTLLPGPGESSTQGGGVRIGCALQINPQEEIEKAVAIAKQVDQVAIIAGLNSDWEAEGVDRTSLDLPGYTDQLIQAISAVNSNVAVVIQSGTPVAMPWVESVPAILQAWYGGNETGNGIADILYGQVNPGAKLPLTFPIHTRDNPAFLNYTSERGRTIYGEDVYIGYRFYEKMDKAVLFPFGHGLSYTSFVIENLKLQILEDQDTVLVSFNVQNVGSREGAYVAQAYVSQRQPSINRPKKELKGFNKTYLEPGSKKQVDISMSLKYATSFWDEKRESWIMEKDTYDVMVGSSSADENMLKDSFQVSKTSWWNGL